MYIVKAKTPVRYKSERYELGETIEIDDEDMNEKIFELVEKVEKEKSLSKMTVPELKEIAKEKGIEGFEDMKKPDLIEAINKKSENESSGKEDDKDPDKKDEE